MVSPPNRDRVKAMADMQMGSSERCHTVRESANDLASSRDDLALCKKLASGTEPLNLAQGHLDRSCAITARM